MKTLSKVFHAFTILGAFIAAGLFVFTMTKSKGAPQEAAGAAMSLCFVIIPYCFARAFDGIIGLDKLIEKREVIKDQEHKPIYKTP